jgi:hypothetical protein
MIVPRYRTVRWLPPATGFRPDRPLVWPVKEPLSSLTFGLALDVWLRETGATVKAVAAGASGHGLLIGRVDMVDSVVGVHIEAGLPGQIYDVDIVLGLDRGAADFRVQLPVARGPCWPASPLLMCSGETWYSPHSRTFQSTPIWANLPWVASQSLGGFWNNSTALSVPNGSTLLPPVSSRLGAFDLYVNSNVVMTAQNPGLQTSGAASGTLFWDSGVIRISP